MLTFERARISAVEHKIANGNVSSRIKVVAKFTAALAEAMEARWVFFDKEQIPKQGYKAIELDYELKNFRLRFHVPKMDEDRLELTSELAQKFKVVRQGNRKKAKKELLVVQFQVMHAGSPFELLEYLLKLGGAEGVMELEPLQREMFDQQAQAAATAATSTPVVVDEKRLQREIASLKRKRGRPRKGDKAALADAAIEQSIREVPKDPDAPEWRTEEEIAGGVPHHIANG